MRLSCLLHLLQNHGGNLLRMELLCLALVLDFDHGLVVLALHYPERPMLHILLHGRILELAADQALRVEHRVCRIPCGLAFCRVAHELL
mmetsp:Transcript_82940/g.231339  ORF Transcript_82940/g.231339 Transcript_82940/m.231339 type:complete len:89 (+) Transcript_82940:1620-1886(+)